MPTTETAITTHTSFVWLVNESSVANEGSKNLIRSNAAVWGHQTRRGKTRSSSQDRGIVTSSIQFRVNAQPCRKAKSQEPNSKKNQSLAVLPSLLQSPSMLQDELFGRQMDHVLVRFHAIAGSQNLEWLKLVSIIRDDKLVHDTFKALICGLDSTTTTPTRRRKCVEILPAIRKRLSSPYGTRCLNMVHLVFLLSYQELLVWNNPKAWMMHIWGLSTIVQTLGPNTFRGILELRTLRQVRLFNASQYATLSWSPVADIQQVALNLFLRRRSFFETAQWLHVPWSGAVAKDLLDHAVDTIVCVPGSLAECDRIRDEGATTKRLHGEVTRMINALNVWRFERLARHFCSISEKPVNVELIVQKLSTGTLVDAHIGQAVVLHLSNWLLLSRLEPIYKASLPWSRQYLIESILSISEEYSYRQQGMGVLPWTFAIRVALFTPLQDDETLKPRGRDLCMRIESRYSVRMLSDIIASLPGANDETLKFDD